jgi:NhaA family Na+:H+ antiporter
MPSTALRAVLALSTLRSFFRREAMNDARPVRLDRSVDPAHDHVLGPDGADITLVEYGSYACPYCHAAHEVITRLRDRFGDRMRYVFRHRPISGNEEAYRAAVLVEQASLGTGEFWPLHDALMQRGAALTPGELDALAEDKGLTDEAVEAAAGEVTAQETTAQETTTLKTNAQQTTAQKAAAAQRVRDDRDSAQRSGALVSPTFFVNGRRYDGAWDESALTEAMLGSLGHRLHAASLDFVRWAPSTGLLLLAMTAVAIALANSHFGPGFEAWWRQPLALSLGDYEFALPLLQWIDDGLLSFFFLVVGLEIKREFTVGRLASPRAAALPIAGALGGMVAPALVYLVIVPAGALSAGWGTTISTDTAFAIALLILLGERVPVELRVFLTAAVIVDDLVAIAVVAIFYGEHLHPIYVAAAAATTLCLVMLNRTGVYRPLPYAVLGVLLWVCLHHAGLHPTLAGVILALVTPTRLPANLAALNAQAEMVIQAEMRRMGDGVMHHGPSEPALRALDVVHDRIESPASKLLRTLEPWSSYVVLPVFALANAGVTWTSGVMEQHAALMAAIMLGLVVGKPIGIVAASALAVGLRIAAKPATYTWRQLAGAGALAGIGFTMSLFIAARAYPEAAQFAAAKIAIFAASLLAGSIGVALLFPRAQTREGRKA